ncbi:hypothetical protein ES703_44171 [subsurface metagenome]
MSRPLNTPTSRKYVPGVRDEVESDMDPVVEEIVRAKVISLDVNVVISSSAYSYRSVSSILPSIKSLTSSPSAIGLSFRRISVLITEPSVDSLISPEYAVFLIMTAP